jgi:hypothetical protein
MTCGESPHDLAFITGAAQGLGDAGVGWPTTA